MPILYPVVVDAVWMWRLDFKVEQRRVEGVCAWIIFAIIDLCVVFVFVRARCCYSSRTAQRSFRARVANKDVVFVEMKRW